MMDETAMTTVTTDALDRDAYEISTENLASPMTDETTRFSTPRISTAAPGTASRASITETIRPSTTESSSFTEGIKLIKNPQLSEVQKETGKRRASYSEVKH